MSKRIFTAVFGVAALSGALSCQSYEVDPVRPTSAVVATKVVTVAQKKAPNVMLVVDKSGSMAAAPDDPLQQAVCPTSGNDQTAQFGGVAANCKWDDLLNAMVVGSTPFISELAARGSNADPVRMGMVAFPSDNVCGAGDPTSGATSVPVAPATSSASTIGSTLMGIAPSGGTPTAASMENAAAALQSVAEDGRSNYIVLLTDGAPNCNADFQATADNCGAGTDYCVSNGSCVGTNQTPPLGCLDEDNLVSKIDAVKQAGILTFVIGFGSDFTSGNLAFDTLTRSAQAGGTAQATTPAFYLATNQDALQAALNAIAAQIGNKCDYPLDTVPASASAIEVIVQPSGGTSATYDSESGKWALQGSDVVITDDSLCNDILSAPADSPTTVSINYLGK